jgi:two-component system, OmpR family, sensor histidine kinase KdpD
MQRIWAFLRSERRFLPGLLTLLITLAITVLLAPERQRLDLAILVLAYMLPVGLSAFLWGFFPGMIGALASFLLLNYYFIPPYGSFAIHRSQHILVLVGFLVLTLIISQLVGRMKQGLSTARARENEAKRLYELSVDFSGLQNEHGILNALARHATETFGAERVELLLDTGSAPDLISWPAGSGSTAAPTAVASLQGTQRLLGEIRLWRPEKAFSEAEDRLLRTFASQGVLALERTRMALAATRSRIFEESDQMKSALLSSVSHELRTPLATIKASVSSLRDPTFDWDAASRSDLLAAIEEETDNLNQLVGNLLNMSRIEAGALTLENEWTDLEEIISPALRRARLASPTHRFELDIPDDLPLVYLDDALMEQVFNNLFSNSIKYSPPGSLIRVQARPQAENILWVQVSNQGPHVPAENLSHIFEKFHRVTAADKITGTGLGLSICKGIIEAHKGHIWAENLPGGFSIQFSIPVHPEKKAGEGSAP